MPKNLAYGNDSDAQQSIRVSKNLRELLKRGREQCREWFVDDIDGVAQSMQLEETHLPNLLRLTVVTLCGGFFLFVLWAALTPVKELARTEGQVLPAGYTRIVQHLEGGLVRDIYVHEGDFVQKDQLLVQLDGAGTEEDSREQQVLVSALSLQAERLLAQLEKREPDFSAINASKEAKKKQMEMFGSTRESHESEGGVLIEQIARKQTAINRLIESRQTARANLKVASESRNIYAKLERDGLVARTTYLDQEQSYNQANEQVNSLGNRLEEARRELAEYEKRAESLTASQRDQAYTELHQVQTSLDQARQNLAKRTHRVDRLEVRSPVMGYVKGLQLNTIGSVIAAGESLMEIVPVNEQLVVELRISPQQVGRVEVGQRVHVKVDSFDYVRFGALPGTLESISAMTFIDELSREDYFKARVKLEKNHLGKNIKKFRILPGMTVDADIVTGEKTLLGYLLKPIQVASHNAFTEQ